MSLKYYFLEMSATILGKTYHKLSMPPSVHYLQLKKHLSTNIWRFMSAATVNYNN